MAPDRAADLLSAYLVGNARSLMAQGMIADDIIAWIEAVEAAFDQRLSELVERLPPPSEEPCSTDRGLSGSGGADLPVSGRLWAALSPTAQPPLHFFARMRVLFDAIHTGAYGG
jgi:hypothetical protein